MPGQEEPVEIIGPLSDGTSSPAATPAELPEVEIRETREEQLSGRTITIQRIKDPGWARPLPTISPATAVDPKDAESIYQSSEIQQWIEQSQESIPLFISATVVDGKATLLRWWHDGTEYRAWSNADWRILTGFSDFRKGSQHFQSLLLLASVETATLPADSEYNIPADLPTQIGDFRTIHGDSSQAMAFEGIRALHQLYRCDYTRLKQAYDLRQQRQSEQAAAQNANPTPSQDIVIRYWKVKPTTQPQTATQPSTVEGGQR